jgi:ubiquinone/menaquinone biosynthesis C-methylase UbiE
MAIKEDIFVNDDEAESPFFIEDIAVFDDETLRHITTNETFGVTLKQLAYSLHNTSPELIKRVKKSILPGKRSYFMHKLHSSLTSAEIELARKQVLDELFWELTYWKTPDLYEALTEGEKIHPAIFQRLDADLRDKVVLDAGAGSGRASFECLHHHARIIYAMEPSQGLRQIFERKLSPDQQKRLHLCSGRFDAIPLPDNSVDVALSCSAFTANPEQGGESGLQEFRRVTRAGGKIVIIWPRIEDLAWFEGHGFHYIAMPVQQEMRVQFRSLRVAFQCVRRFYASRQDAIDYLLTRQRPDVPFSLLHMHPPCDYCWLEVEK